MFTPQLQWFATMTVQVGASFRVKGGPMGTRLIAEVDSVEVTGDRLTASLVGTSAADWVTVAPDRSYGIIDVRLTLETDDGEIVYVEYGGRIEFATGQVVSAPTFQTGAEKYDWLNRIQAVGVGQNGPDQLVYELYEVVR